MRPLYFDTSYLFKIYWPESGSDQVLLLAKKVDLIVCCVHGRAEFSSACRRKIREGTTDKESVSKVMKQFCADCKAGGIEFLPITDSLLDRLDSIYQKMPSTSYLRSFDALHLACAAENDFQEVYSNDRHFLAAAPLFGLNGVNVIPR